jgi:hypothetical protein
MNSVPTLQADLAMRIGMLAANLIDAAAMGQYASLTNFTPVGTPGTALTSQVYDAAIGALLGTGRGEPVFVIVPNTSAGAIGIERQARILPTGGAVHTGSAPVTTHTIALLPSLFAIQTSVLAPVNDATHAEAVSTVSGVVSIIVGIANTGSGLQAVYVRVTGIVLLIDQTRGVQVSS